MAKVKGAFRFLADASGALSGQYFNNNIDRSLSENALCITHSTEGAEFCGTYDTTWEENEGGNIKGQLMVTKKSAEIYTFRWSGNKKHYAGEAMLVDNVFIGWYEDVD